MISKPPPLKPGDKVGIIIPASPVKEPFRQKGLQRLRELGYVPVEVDNVLERISPGDFLAKTPRENLRHIRNFLEEKEIKALWAGRGGYGSNYLLPLLPQLNIDEPKIIIGSSDISYILWHMVDNCQMAAFYGPMVYSSLAENRFDVDSLRKALQGNFHEIRIPGKILLPGKAKGIVTGGCLSNFVSLIGTPFQPVVEQRILLLEDVGERPYRLDRMVWQLAHAGLLDRIEALLLGEFPGCFKDSQEKECFLLKIRNYLKDRPIPVIYDLPVGHSSNIHTLPLGIAIEIDSSGSEESIVLEPGWQDKG